MVSSRSKFSRVPKDLYERIKEVVQEYAASTISVWKCSDCSHANKGGPEDLCYWCGSKKRQSLNPVKEANAQQNTPSIKDLNERIDRDEKSRFTNETIEAQIRRLIEAFYKEKDKKK